MGKWLNVNWKLVWASALAGCDAEEPNCRGSISSRNPTTGRAARPGAQEEKAACHAPIDHRGAESHLKALPEESRCGMVQRDAAAAAQTVKRVSCFSLPHLLRPRWNGFAMRAGDFFQQVITVKQNHVRVLGGKGDEWGQFARRRYQMPGLGGEKRLTGP